MIRGLGGVIFVDGRVGWWTDSPVGSEAVMEVGHLREIKEIEIAQLHLRYGHTRIKRPKENLALAGSLERVTAFGHHPPHPRLLDRQQTCGAKACQRKWHARKYAEWNRKNRAYFKEIYRRGRLESFGSGPPVQSPSACSSCRIHDPQAWRLTMSTRRIML